MLERTSRFIVKYRWIFVAIFVALTIFSAVMIFHTKIVYDLSTYVPPESETKEAVSLIKQEFDDKGSATVVVKGVTQEEATTICNDLNNIDGVAIATFDAKKDYKSDSKSVLFTISLEDYDATDASNATIKRIIAYTDDMDVYMCGQSATSYFTQLETVESIMKIAIFIVIAIVAMLLFTSKTYFELVVMAFVFIVSIITNVGTNFVFNGISYISNLVSLVLQLALSIDYAVILLHRFMEERDISDTDEALVAALKKGIPEILSSSLTTIAGLCSLLFMSLPIGVEMGFSLAKGIVFSLLTVVFFMPAMLKIFDKLLQKSKHKSFVPNVTKPAKAIVKARKIIVPIFIAVIVFSAVGQFRNSYGFNINSCAKTVSDQKVIAEEFGQQNPLVIIVPKGDYQKEKELIEYVKSKELINNAMGLTTIEVAEGLYLTDTITLNQITEIGSSLGLTESMAKLMLSGYINEIDADNEIPIEEYRFELLSLLEYASQISSTLDLGEYGAQLAQISTAKSNFESGSYSRIMFNINSTTESAESFAIIEDLRANLGQFYAEYYIAGESAACYDMAQAFPNDNLKVTLITLFSILLILFITFRNVLFPVVLMVAIQGGIWINFVIPFVSGNPVFFIGYLLISSIQMGATIDYGIIMTTRFKELKKTCITPIDAISQAENAVFPTIITSGTILTFTGFTLQIAGTGIVSNLGMLLGIGTALSVFIVLFVLPSMLLVFDKFIEKTDFSLIAKGIKKCFSNTKRQK